MITYLFIALYPKRESSWHSFLPARRLWGTIWPLWRRIIPDSEILETAVSLHCGANTKAVPWGSTDWVCLLLSHNHRALQGSTGGHASEMKKDMGIKLIIINIFLCHTGKGYNLLLLSLKWHRGEMVLQCLKVLQETVEKPDLKPIYVRAMQEKVLAFAAFDHIYNALL